MFIAGEPSNNRIGLSRAAGPYPLTLGLSPSYAVILELCSDRFSFIINIW